VPIRVMLVEDSAIVRGLITRALEADPQIELLESASNGQVAVNNIERIDPDVVILDIEMPEMDGLTALPILLQKKPGLVVIMASTLTTRNAEISMKALELGATDYIPKPEARDRTGLDDFHKILKEKIKTLGATARARRGTITPTIQPLVKPIPKVEVTNKDVSQPVRALAIASSTGGPQALMAVFSGLKDKLAGIPIFITQHMPPKFTTILGDHLTKTGTHVCAEGINGEIVKPGRVYIAPGDYHMTIRKDGLNSVIHLDQNPPVNFCRPSADPMLESLVTIYGNSLLTVVLTGIGHDGLEGSRKVVAAGGSVIAQDEASCVVWGMPRAVTENNLCQAVLPLSEIATYLIRNVRD
jgi:two-component system chemotaxis response regulator CheB